MNTQSTAMAPSFSRHFRQGLPGLLALVGTFEAACVDQQGLLRERDEPLTSPSPSTTPATTSEAGTDAQPTGPAASGEDDLIAYWPFDDGNTAVTADVTGNRHDGTVLDGRASPGVSGLGMSFTGDGSGVDVEDGPAFELTNSFTIEAWFNATRLHDGHNLIFFRGDSRPGLDPYFVTIYPDATLRFAVQNEANDIAWATVPVSLGKFHHMAAVFDGASAMLKLYLDGQLRATTSTNIKPMQRLLSSQGPGIGIGHHAFRTGNDYGFIGTIDEVRLYRRALAASQVEQHFLLH
jgi:hypothetical protein